MGTGKERARSHTQGWVYTRATGKKIDIKNNSYYKDLLGETDEVVKIEEAHPTKLSADEKVQLRERISTIFHDICNVLHHDEFGDEYWGTAFETNTYFDNEKTQNALENMEVILVDHILECDIKPSIIWGSDFIINDYNKIPVESIEAALEFYKTVKSKYNEYITPFLNAVCEIINRHYRKVEDDSGEDLPF